MSKRDYWDKINDLCREEYTNPNYFENDTSGNITSKRCDSCKYWVEKDEIKQYMFRDNSFLCDNCCPAWVKKDSDSEKTNSAVKNKENSGEQENNSPTNPATSPKHSNLSQPTNSNNPSFVPNSKLSPEKTTNRQSPSLPADNPETNNLEVAITRLIKIVEQLWEMVKNNNRNFDVSLLNQLKKHKKDNSPAYQSVNSKEQKIDKLLNNIENLEQQTINNESKASSKTSLMIGGGVILTSFFALILLKKKTKNK